MRKIFKKFLKKLYDVFISFAGLDIHPEKNQFIKRLICVDDVAQGKCFLMHRFSPILSWREKSVWPLDFRGHAWFLYDLLVQLRAKVIVEFGIHTGQSTLVLAAAAQQNGGKLFSVDPSDKYRDFVDFNLRYYGLNKSWERVIDDSIKFREKWRKLSNDSLIDFILIDSKHEYNLKLKEIELWLPLIKKGGVIAFHDVLHRIDNNQAAIDKFLEHKNVCYIETDGWRISDDSLTAHAYNDGHSVNLNLENGRPYAYLDEFPAYTRLHKISTNFLKNPRLKITHKEAEKRGFQYSYEVRTNSNGLGILCKHY